MTNLLATILITVTTNWTDVARVTPIVPESERSYAIYRSSSTIQRGQILTNTVARFNYEGREVEVVLKSQSAPFPIERTVSDLDRTGGFGFTNGLVIGFAATNVYFWTNATPYFQ